MTFLINLESSASRLTAMTEHLNKLGISFERVAAIDARGVDINFYSAYDAISTQRRHGRQLGSGEVGCYLSHVKALETFAVSDAEYGLICEDDIKLPDDTKLFLNDFIEFSKSQGLNWDMLFLGLPLKSHVLGRLYFGHNREIFRVLHLPVTTSAILWSKEGAKAFLNSKSSTTIRGPVDYAVRGFSSMRGRSLGLTSKFVSFLEILSDIDANGGGRHPNELKISSKIKILIYRKLVDRINELKSFLRLVFLR